MSQSNHEYMLRQAMMNAGLGITTTPTSIPSEKTNAERRAEFLETVRNFVCKDRNVTHGDAEDNFRVIAELWNVYMRNSKGEELNNKDVAIMMCLFKVSRLMSNVDNLENWLDLAGYAACGGGIVMKKLEEEKR
jgi:hypothetical protein